VHVLFIDIVAYSKLAIDQQKEVVQELNQYVRDSEKFRRADTAGKLIRIPAWRWHGAGLFHQSRRSSSVCD
jgi:hypothetical protein